MALGRELHARGGAPVTLQLHAEPDDPFLVAKQSLGLFAHVRLEGRREVEVDAGHDHFVGILAVHVSPYGFR